MKWKLASTCDKLNYAKTLIMTKTQIMTTQIATKRKIKQIWLLQTQISIHANIFYTSECVFLSFC